MKKTRKYFIFLVLGFLVLGNTLFARGTKTGVAITNAKRVGIQLFTSEGTNYGDLSATYSNTTGENSLAGWIDGLPQITLITNAYDLSTWHATTSQTQYVTAGTVVIFSNWITNYANVSMNLRLRLTNKGITSSWLSANPYSLWWNGILLVSGQALDTVTGIFPSDERRLLKIQINVPGFLNDGDTNRFIFSLNDPAGNNGTGDNWPGVNAIPPSTDDSANKRDFQSFEFYLKVQGPVLRISKTVDYTTVRPYEVLTYTIYVTNVGSGIARGVTVKDVIPENTTNVANSISWWSNATGPIFKTDTEGDDQAEIVTVGGRKAVQGKWSVLLPGGYGKLMFKVKVK